MLAPGVSVFELARVTARTSRRLSAFEAVQEQEAEERAEGG